MKNAVNTCPICGSDALVEKSDHAYSFSHGRKKHTIDGLKRSLCSDCGVSLFLPSQLKSNNARVREFQSALVDFISPAQVLELREKYMITQADANKIFGGGPTAFSKYERGLASPNAGIARQMLRALKDGTFMASLAAPHGIDINSSESGCAFAASLPVRIKQRIEKSAGYQHLAMSDNAYLVVVEKALDALDSSVAQCAASSFSTAAGELLRHPSLGRVHGVVAINYSSQDFDVTPTVNHIVNAQLNKPKFRVSRVRK